MVSSLENGLRDKQHWNLRVFCVVAELQSVSLAANRLLMSQSGVSMIVHRLEERTGAKLLERRDKHLVLTEAGVEVYRYALESLRAANDLQATMRALKERNGWAVTVATGPTLNSYFLSPVLVRFGQKHPDVLLRVVDVVQPIMVLRSVLDKGVDFAVLSRGPGVVLDADMTIEVFHREPLVVVAAPDHPFARVQGPTLEQIARQPFIVNSSDSGQIALLEDRFRSTGAGPLRIAAEINGDAAKQLVRAGLGLSLMLRCRVDAELARGELRTIELPGEDLFREFVIVYYQDRQFSDAAMDLLSIIREGEPMAERLAGYSTSHLCDFV